MSRYVVERRRGFTRMLWRDLTRAEGALDHEPFGRTRSKAFAERVVEALNRVNPR